MSSSALSLVPTLSGSNWIQWNTQMKAYLMSQGLWQIVSGTEVVPDEPQGRPTTRTTGTGESAVTTTTYTAPDPALITEWRKEFREWTRQDSMANGDTTGVVLRGINITTLYTWGGILYTYEMSAAYLSGTSSCPRWCYNHREPREAGLSSRTAA